MGYKLAPYRTLGVAIINDERAIVDSLKNDICSAFPGACVVATHDDLWTLWGSHLYQFVFIDVGALSQGLTEDIAHTHHRIGKYMVEHPWIRLVITSRLPRALMTEHLDGIRDAADGRQPLFLGSFNGAVVDIISEHLPEAIRAQCP